MLWRWVLTGIGACVIWLASGQGLSQSADPLRIVSLAPATTEILVELGCADEIVGVSQFCDYPPAMRAKEKVGTFSRPNLEKILWLKPDLVVCTGLEQAPAASYLRQLGLRVCISDPASFEELFVSIRQIGQLTGRGARAEELIARMREQIDEISRAVTCVPESARPKVFVEIWHSPLLTAGKGSFVDEMIGLAGGVNIASDTRRPYTFFSPEEVIRRDPDCIIFTGMESAASVDQLARGFVWSDVSAVRNGRLYKDIDPDLILKPGPRLVEGLRQIHRRLYPEKT